MSAVADEAGCFEPGFSSVSAVIKVDCLAKECPRTISVAHARHVTLHVASRVSSISPADTYTFWIQVLDCYC